MITGNVKRLIGYLRLQGTPLELACVDGLSRMYESDRLLANPFRIDTAPPRAQATRLFAKIGEPDPWTDPPIAVPVLARPAKLDGPASILGLVDILSGRRDIGTSAELVTADLQVQIDQFALHGVAQWNAWVSYLRSSPRVPKLELVPGSLTGKDNPWLLNCQWQGLKGGQPSISPQFSLTFMMANDRVATIQTRRADYTFVIGDAILPQVAFAWLTARLMAGVSP
jgi:hypothetical protein